MKKCQLPDIPESENTPLVKRLVNIIEQLVEHIEYQQEQIDTLKDEVRVLKGQKKRPKFKPSKRDKDTPSESDNDADSASSSGKKPGRRKSTHPTDRNVRLKPNDIPPGSTFHGVRHFKVQELVIRSEHICYELERWKTPEGHIMTARPPVSGHFGHHLISYALYQHHHCQVTQPLLLEQLREWDVQISSGQLNHLMQANQEAFCQEKNSLLETALAHSDYITVDDSGARHKGKNGYVTHMGNKWFGWFCSTPSKSRLNFLTLLCAGEVQYRLSPEAFDYMQQHKLPLGALTPLECSAAVVFNSEQAWLKHLAKQGITHERHIRIATEGALIGHLLHKGDLDNLAIISDGAGQFAVFEHGLCWVHTERLIRNLIPVSEQHRQEVDEGISQIWALYRKLKDYRLSPTQEKAGALSDEFDRIFTRKTHYITLNRKLEKIYAQKNKLLLVLEYPQVPLHTNGSETDIRDYVKKRKVSGGTRSDYGRQCRDTFASLKKTCRKLGISFWTYLQDRLTKNEIPPLAVIMREKMSAP